METIVKIIFLENLHCFKRYGILKCTYVSKNSKKRREIQKSKLNNPLTKFLKKNHIPFYHVALF